MVTTRTFAQRCTKLALDIERNALELRSEQGYEIEQLQLCYAL